MPETNDPDAVSAAVSPSREPSNLATREDFSTASFADLEKSEEGVKKSDEDIKKKQRRDQVLSKQKAETAQKRSDAARRQSLSNVAVAALAGAERNAQAASKLFQPPFGRVSSSSSFAFHVQGGCAFENKLK